MHSTSALNELLDAVRSKLASQASNVVSIGEPLITDIEAAPLVGLAVQTLRDDRNKRRYNIPYYRIGRAIRYRRSDIEMWLAKHAVAGTEVA